MIDQPGDIDAIDRHCIAIVARARQLPPETVTLDSSLEAMQVDSLDKVSLSFDLEDAYNINIPDSALFEVKTVGDIARGVRAALARRAGNAKAADGATQTAGIGSEQTNAGDVDGHEPTSRAVTL